MRRWLMGAGAVLTAAMLAACTSSSGGSSKDASGPRAAGGAVAGPARVPGGKPLAPGVAGGTAKRGANGGGGTSGGGSVHDTSTARLVGDDSAKIQVAQMTVDIARGKVAAAADRAESIALGVGGDVDTDDRTSGRYATASLLLRVPPPSLTSVLGQLSRLGHERSRQLSTTDVTERVADVNSRVASAQEAIARLRGLYASASKVADVIAVEAELSQRESDLESLQAQQRALQRQTSLASITLTLQTATPPAKPAPKHHHHATRSGFVGGLDRGWHGFVAAAKWVGTAVGTLLPFLALFALIGLAARFAWRRRPHPAPQPTPSE